MSTLVSMSLLIVNFHLSFTNFLHFLYLANRESQAISHTANWTTGYSKIKMGNGIQGPFNGC